MRAAVWHGYKDIRIEEVPLPVPGPGQVRITVDWAGICGTDRHEYEGPNFIPTSRPHRLTGIESDSPHSDLPAHADYQKYYSHEQ